MKITVAFLFSVGLVGLSSVASAQQVGGVINGQTFTTSTAAVKLPASSAAFPFILIIPASGSTAQLYYTYGSSSITASTATSRSLPPGGICENAGTQPYIAGITSSGTATVNVTQVAYCPLIGFAGGGGGGGGGGGSTSVTYPTVSGASAVIDTSAYTPVFSGSGNTVSGLTAAVFTSGTTVVFTDTGGSLPAGVTAGQPYLISTSSSTVATLTTVTGSPVTFSSAGTGTQVAAAGYTISINSGMATLGTNITVTGSPFLSFLVSFDGVSWVAPPNLSSTNVSETLGVDIAGAKYFTIFVSAPQSSQTFFVGWNQSVAGSKNVSQQIVQAPGANFSLESGGNLDTISATLGNISTNTATTATNTGLPIPTASINDNPVGAIQLCDQSTLTSPNCATVSNHAVAMQQAQNVSVATCSGTSAIVTGGTAVTLCAAQSTVRLITICNDDRTHPTGGEDAWFNIKGGTATISDYANSFRLPAPSTTSYSCYNLLPGFNGAISFVAATSGHIIYEVQE
jgi:hypothetical protein